MRTSCRAATAAFAAVLAFLSSFSLHGAAMGAARRVAIVVEPEPSRVARHGIDRLTAVLKDAGFEPREVRSLDRADADFIILVGGAAQLRALNAEPPTVPQSLVVRNAPLHDRPALIVCGGDDRGLMYALLDTAERIGWKTDPDNPFKDIHDVSEQPYTRDRALSVYLMNRDYWESRFYDEKYWARYFDMLAADRFTKFRMVFGYENGGFLAPCYPYFFDTPGFDQVHMVNLTDEQQKKNRDAMNRLIEMAHDRGIDVAVGIWDHIYRAGVQTGGAEWVNDYKDRPIPNTVEGVTTGNLNAYTLASLKRFVEVFPAIDEIQFRIHEESGLKREEMEGFWREVFTMAKQVKPDLLFEARGKGTPDVVIDTAISLGVHLRVETKYWMEQMGLPFHPTHIPPEDQKNRRHGYADFLRYPKRYDMNWGLWNGGTSRVLLWGDPEYVRRFVQSTYLYDSPNWDVNEPLATKMEAQRPDMKAFALMPEKYRYYEYEFERYWHFYQVWGRVGYNPQTPSELWDHEFVRRFGPDVGPHVEAAMHRASWVLPYIVASVYPYSAFPMTRGWAERQSLGASLEQYAKNTGSDVQQFESFREAAARIVTHGVATKRTPDDVSAWLSRAADDIEQELSRATTAAGAHWGKELDSTITDLRVLEGLARFHAGRSRAAVHYDIYQLNGDRVELALALDDERGAVRQWRDIVQLVDDRYNFDLAMGARNFDLCGHWRDELAKLETAFEELKKLHSNDVAMAYTRTWQFPGAPPSVDGDRITSAKPHEALRITARVTDPSGIQSVRLRFRNVTQFEEYRLLDMEPTGQPDEWAATVPGPYLSDGWDFMYFIEATTKDGRGTQWPDLDKEAPYVIVKLQR